MKSRKKKVLIVDDEAGFTDLLKLNLEESGNYEVHVENEAGRATQAVRWFEPHVVLMDMIMPDLSGREAVERIRRQHGLEQLPVIFLTAALSRDDATMHGSHVDGIPLLSKPATLEQITEAIEKHALP
jgi:CheY-like chemotaxis protein